ncbi:MAG: hypothetical protein ACOCWZ_10400 [Spirochaetota bacterium]
MDGMTRIMQRIQDIEKRFGLMRHNQESVANAGDPQKVSNFDENVKQAMKSNEMQPVQPGQPNMRQGVTAAEGVMNTLSNGMNNGMLPGNMLNGNQSGLSGLMKLLPDITRHLQGENEDKGSGKNSTIPGSEAASRYNSNYIPVE